MSPEPPHHVQLPEDDHAAIAENVSERRADIDRKHVWIAERLQALGCEGLLVLSPENVSWLTSGAVGSGILEPDHQPGLFYTAEQRWLLCCNTQTQRHFDEELNDLGFQVKEWPWHWGRQWLIDALCEGRILACDRRLGDCRPVGDELARRRRNLSRYEQACLRTLGRIVGHALEATCRTMTPKLSEEEVAGQLSHRLIRRGARPVKLGVAADGRSARQRCFQCTATPVTKHAVVQVTAQKYGLHASATRAVCFGGPSPALRQEFDTACKVTAVYASLTRPNASAQELIAAGKQIYRHSGFEHDWREHPFAHLAGRLPTELELLPGTVDLLQAGWCVTLTASAGAALSHDTFLIRNDTTELITTMESWAVKKLRISGDEFQRPYLLVR